MRRFLTCLVAAAAAALAASLCVAQEGEAKPAAAPTTQPAGVQAPPKPMVVPQYWQFDLDAEPLLPIELKLPGSAQPQLFWYLRYTVTNKGGGDHVFVPEFVLYADTGEIIRTGQRTSTQVFLEIQKLYKDPLMNRQTAVTRKLLSGEDNAQSSVAIWPDFDPNAGTVDIFIGGLSGETKKIPLPAPIQVVETDWKGERHTVTRSEMILSKTLHLRYEVPGQASARKFVKPRLVLKEWVMR